MSYQVLCVASHILYVGKQKELCDVARYPFLSSTPFRTWVSAPNPPPSTLPCSYLTLSLPLDHIATDG